MEKLTFKNRILIGLTLFSMFFGAGNLIFPPYLGAQAGNHVWAALTGFALSAIGLPVLGVAAVALSDGLRNLAQKVHPVFASAFTILMYLSIGPFLAIPRTAGTSYEMAAAPFLNTGADSRLFLAIYSIGFFAIATLLALKPDKLTDRLGKILGPLLLVLIGVVFIGCQMHSGNGYGETIGNYQKHPVVEGFLYGYQTMDTIAALNFGIIISMNIRTKGVKKESSVIKETIFSGMITGLLLLAVYSALAQVGAVAGARFGVGENGAGTLSQMMGYLYGSGGKIILGAIFFIACLNTCTGLLSCCSEYFYTLWPKISYRKWVLIFAWLQRPDSQCGAHGDFKNIHSGTEHYLSDGHYAHRSGIYSSVDPQISGGISVGYRINRHKQYCLCSGTDRNPGGFPEQTSGADSTPQHRTRLDLGGSSRNVAGDSAFRKKAQSCIILKSLVLRMLSRSIRKTRLFIF